MYRISCSYFITLTGVNEDLKRAGKYLEEKDVTGKNGFMFAEYESDEEVNYEVSDGAVDQWSDFEECMEEMASLFPALKIDASENCEEPYTPGVHLLFENGTLKHNAYGRRLDPDEYDPYTGERIVAYLRNIGANKAADAVSEFILQ